MFARSECKHERWSSESEKERVRVRVSMEPFVEQHLVYRTCTLNANTTTHTANLIFSASHEGAKFYFQFELMLDLGRQRWARASVCREHVYRKFNLQIDLLRFWILLHKVLVIVSWTASVDSMPILFSFFPRMSSRSKKSHPNRIFEKITIFVKYISRMAWHMIGVPSVNAGIHTP